MKVNDPDETVWVIYITAQLFNGCYHCPYHYRLPTWDDRMTEAEIQAIVGFIRQWEPTAPEVATLTRPGVGPPWRNNASTNTNTKFFGLLPATNPTISSQSGNGKALTANILDWRALLLAGILLSALKKQKV